MNQNPPLNEPAKITNGEKLVKMMQDDDIKKRIQEKIASHGYIPVLILEIKSNDDTEYELDEDDIKEVFSRFGFVENVKLLENSKVLIYFQNATNAGLAQKALNNHQIDEFTLIVNWWLPKEIEALNEQQLSEKEKQLIKKDSEVQKNDEKIDKNDSDSIDKKKQDVEGKEKADEISDKNAENTDEYFKRVRVKYTARYDILIENEKKFQVCRRVIGPKGANMKQIIDLSCQNSFLPSYSSMNDIVKLRLRGKGSGFKEGNLLQESNENLHLCVSSKYHHIYIHACYLVEKLLLSIYEDYRIFCLRNMINLSRPLCICKKEFINGGGHPPTPVPTDFSFFGNSNNVSYFAEERINAEQSQKNWMKGKIGSNSLSYDEKVELNTEKMKNWEKSSSGLNSSKNKKNVKDGDSAYQDKTKFEINKVQPNSAFIFGSPQGSSSDKNFNDKKFYYLNGEENSNVNEGQDGKNKQLFTRPILEDEHKKDSNGISIKYDPNEMSNYDAIPHIFFYQNSIYNEQNKFYDAKEEFSFLQTFENLELNEENISKLIEARNKARKELKFYEADYIRAFLKNRGIALIDEKGARGKGVEVTTWKYLKYWKGRNNMVEC